MRFVAASAVIAACLIVSMHVKPELPRVSIPHAASNLTKDAAGKPGRDTCRWANDHECDEPDIGTGACNAGTDYSDCRHLRAGEDNSCQFANDGECDEPNFGTGACTQGTDLADCGNIAWLRNETDSCATAFDGVCEEEGHEHGSSCAPRTDRSDCLGRDRPMNIADHFFGHDDRVLLPQNRAPWKYVGQLVMDTDEACTATLIAANVIVTAAHCISGADGTQHADATFTASDGSTARVVAYLIDRRFDYRRFSVSNEQDGMDWALLRLDHRLGDTVGFAGVQNLTGQGAAVARRTPLMQGGFAWDTGDNLAGVTACHLVAIHSDNTFEHQCDTTRGDSGSSFFVPHGDGFDVIGVDSNFRSRPGVPYINIAVSASAFASHVPDFVAGRSGVRVDSKKK
ncbi:MAG: trypsin-like serine protease [Terricaulis sp.]